MDRYFVAKHGDRAVAAGRTPEATATAAYAYVEVYGGVPASSSIDVQVWRVGAAEFAAVWSGLPAFVREAVSLMESRPQGRPQ